MRDWSMLANFHAWCPLPDGSLDAQTWSELDLSALYARLDRTLSTPVACLLYRILHLPLVAAKDWDRRRSLVRVLGENRSAREQLRSALREAGSRRGPELVTLLWDELPPPSASLWAFRALAAAAVAALVLACLTLALGPFLLLLALIITNATIHYRQQRELDGRLGALHQVRHLMDASARAGRLPSPELAQPAAHLRALAQQAHRLARRLHRLLPEFSSSASGDLASALLEYLDIFLLHQVRTYYASLAELRSQLPALREMFCLLGELDACQSIAHWRSGLDDWSEPEIAASGPLLEITAARHPLIENPVPNSLELATPGLEYVRQDHLPAHHRR